MNRVMRCFAFALFAAVASAREADPPQSIYHLETALTSQDGQHHGLDLYRGSPVLVTMFYGSCQATCPLIIDTLRATERGLTAEQRARVRVLLISFDPERDTPEALRQIAAERRIDTSRWTLAYADPETVRDIAALLGVQYRKLPGGEFNHSTVIVALSPQGEIAARTSELGHADPAILAKLTGIGPKP
jgi:protein SCO1/2